MTGVQTCALPISFVFLRESLSGTYLAALAIMLIGTAFVVADTLIRNHVHQHHHSFSHTHDGVTHTHTVSHVHEHNHYMSENRHGHRHTRAELERALGEAHIAN